MYRFIPLLLWVLLLPGLAGARTTVAVFDIEDQTRRLKKRQLRTLQDLLVRKLVERRSLQAVPREALRAALTKKRRRRCFDWRCQKAVAKSLKAQYVMATKIIKQGRKCMVMGSLYNIKAYLLGRSASIKSRCKLAALAAVMARLPAKLIGKPGGKKAIGGAAAGSPDGFDEPGMGAGETPRPGPRKVNGVAPVTAPARRRKPMPLWPGLAAAGVGVVGLTLGIPFIALDGTGHNCDGDALSDCAQLWDTGTMGWIFTGLGVGALATSGLLLYFHYFAGARERRAGALPAFTVMPTQNGGLFVGATGRF